MNIRLLKYLIFLLLFSPVALHAQEIWKESFDVPNKGIWGGVDGKTIHADFDGIHLWTLEYSAAVLSNADDYAKTVSTTGGRFECRDINGEITWKSEILNISAFDEVRVQLIAAETGSGKNEETKYLKASIVLDGNEMPFDLNAENLGNWGESLAEHKSIKGNELQIRVKINNHYSSDKVILDEVVVVAVDNFPVILTGEVLINEVLFDPFPEGSDYVEIYNNSDKEIPLHHLMLASRDKNLEIVQNYPLTSKRKLLYPGEYLVLTQDTNGVFPRFTIICPTCFLQMPKLPSFNNDEDYVVLLNKNQEVVDELFYTDELHSPLLADAEGVALERISFAAPGSSKSNWFSASSTSGYGTPGYENSQIEAEVASPVITFSPDAFSPNFDGYNDEFIINYQLDKPGYIANVWIFDAAGRPVVQLFHNEILGTSGDLFWNGEDNTGQKQAPGIYIALVEIFDTVGNVFKFKNGVVLTDVLK